jgi:iron-sulfur cluster assembly protein
LIDEPYIEKKHNAIYKPDGLAATSIQNVVYLWFGINPNKAMIKVSLQAKEKVVQMMQSDGVDIASHFVRVGVKSGGCSGLSYELKFDASLGEDDKIFEDNDVRIVVDKKSFLYLVGTTLEYSGGLNGKGFVFNNPNANRTCGCGESFSL